eukprot:364880-Chlamydomonas_euryale.AAC.5
MQVWAWAWAADAGVGAGVGVGLGWSAGLGADVAELTPFVWWGGRGGGFGGEGEAEPGGVVEEGEGLVR